jgi:hypothetical protein
LRIVDLPVEMYLVSDSPADVGMQLLESLLRIRNFLNSPLVLGIMVVITGPPRS